MNTEIISEIILIIAIFVVGAAIVIWAVADGVSGTQLRQRNASAARGEQAPVVVPGQVAASASADPSDH